MRKFIVYSKKGKTSVMEVECELIHTLEDTSIMYLKSGEYKARILSPTLFHQKVEKITEDGKKITTLVPDVWFSHSFYETIELAKIKAESLVLYEFEFGLQKHGASFSEEDVQAGIQAIEIVML